MTAQPLTNFFTAKSQAYKLGKIENAEACFMEAVRINPNYLNARINLFKTLKETGKFREALKQGKSIIAGNDVPYPDVCCIMGEACFALSMYKEARDNARKALGLNSRYGQAFFLLAQIHVQQGNPREAIKELKQCLNSNPSKELHAKARELLYDLKELEYGKTNK